MRLLEEPLQLVDVGRYLGGELQHLRFLQTHGPSEPERSGL